MLLRVRDLESGYGRIQVLHGVSIEVADGEVVSMLGTNGAGKTTTLRAISGVIPAWRGTIEFGGRLLGRLAPESRARLGLGHVPEGRGVLATLTVEENLGIAAGLRPDGKQGYRKDRSRLLDIFSPLQGKLNMPAGSLSGGQQQMLALARALVARPRLLMVDEMSFGLAPVIVDQLFQLVRDFRAEAGTTFLLVEQNAGVLEVSDRTYVITGGRTVLESKSKELAGSDRLVRSYLGHSDDRAVSPDHATGGTI